MTNRLRLAEFALESAGEGEPVYLRAFHNPADLWNGWNKPHAMRAQIESYCERLGLTCFFTPEGTAIIRYTLVDGEYQDEFPLVTCDTYKIGHCQLYDLSGWCWLEKSRL